MSSESLYGLVLLAAAAHAIWNALVKRAADALLMMAAIRLVGLVFGLAVVPFLPWPNESTWVLLALACTATFAYYGLLIHCYQIGDLSLVYPIARGSAPLVLALIAFLVIDEHLTATQIAGIVLISVGILALVIGKGNDRRAVGYALATGISIATYSFLGGLGVRSSASVFGFQAWHRDSDRHWHACVRDDPPAGQGSSVRADQRRDRTHCRCSIGRRLSGLSDGRKSAAARSDRRPARVWSHLRGHHRSGGIQRALWHPPHRCGGSHCGRRSRNSCARVLLTQKPINSEDGAKGRDRVQSGVFIPSCRWSSADRGQVVSHLKRYERWCQCGRPRPSCW